jgi:tRNA(Leu) C34 or U34 (ribose-2'-O)-methylase TrmL
MLRPKRKPNGRYAVRWREGGHQRQQTFDRREVAERFATRLNDRLQSRGLVDLDQGTTALAEFVVAYWRDYAIPNLSLNTQQTYIQVWAKHLEPRIGHRQLRELTPKRLAALRAELGRAGVGDPTVLKASDTTKAWRHLPLFHFESMDDLHAHLPYGCPLVGIELDPRAVPLSGFKHPERACYVLGAEDHGLSLDALERCHAVIQLPGTYCLNVAVAGSIVLHHRLESVGGGRLLPVRRETDAGEGPQLRHGDDHEGSPAYAGRDRTGMDEAA